MVVSAAATAQSLDYGALELLFDEPVTTSVTGSPMRESEVPAAMQIITADDIRRSGARDIPGVLTHLSGIDVRRRTAEHADVAIRGYNQAFTPRLLVLIDGRQVYADYYGFTPWSTLPIELEAIRQIEVVKGPSGALFGFNAVGGVINIVTYDALHDAPVSTVSMRLGTQDLREASAVTTMRFNDASALRISAGSRRSDDFSTAQQPADLGTRRGNERNAVSADAHFALSPTLGFGIEATYGSAAQAEVPPTYSMSYTDYESRSLRTHWVADTRYGLVEANLYKNWIEADAFLLDQQAPFLNFDNDVLVAQIEDVFKIGASHVVRVAGEYRENSMATTPIGGAEVFYDVVSLTGMWNWRLTSALALTTAVRGDDWSLGRTGFVPPETSTPSGLTNDDWDITRGELSFNAGLVWQTPDAGTFRFAAARARQLPNLLNLGGLFFEFFGSHFLGMPSLKPSAVTNYELDWTRVLEPSGASVRVSAFRGDTRDVQNAFFGNLGSSATRGLELALDGSIGESWQWSASYSLQHVRDDLDADWPTEFTLVDFERTTPERVLKAHVGWSRGPWRADGFVRYQSSFLSLRGPDPGEFAGVLVPISSHAALDGRLAYRVGERVNVAISGRNLHTSSQRQTSSPEVERSLWATVELSF